MEMNIEGLDYSQMSPKILYGYCGLVPEMGDCYHNKRLRILQKGNQESFQCHDLF